MQIVIAVTNDCDRYHAKKQPDLLAKRSISVGGGCAGVERKHEGVTEVTDSMLLLIYLSERVSLLEARE